VRVPVGRGTGGVSQRRTAGSTLELVDTKKEIRGFLTSRRARITPEQAGLRSFGSRRVPGLRREEVAVLAGVSVPYYTRLERGDMSGVSQSVLEALARALELDDAEHAHLFDLARAAQPTGAGPRRRRAKQRVRPEVQWTLDAITGAAAFVGNQRLDILAANPLGRALFSELYAAPTRPVNNARFVFLDPRAEVFYGDWERVAGECVAILRWAAGRDPDDRDLSDLVGELATQSEAFRTRWAAHDVRFHNHRRQALPSSRGRRAQPELQPAGSPRRPRADDLHLRRRARLAVRRGAQPPRQLGRHCRPRRVGARDRPS
jgi:transcriptional regulator with XRE-family HTH domain